jgi:hypothetical protein
MTILAKQHTYRITLTRCPRCKAQPNNQAWGGPTWLHEVTILDGVQSVHALLCRRPSCNFAEIRGLICAGTMSVRRPSWLRVAISRHPLTFAAAAVVNGLAVGFVVAFT